MTKDQIDLLRAEIEELRAELEARTSEVVVLKLDLSSAREALVDVDRSLTVLCFPPEDAKTLSDRIFDLSRFGEAMHCCQRMPRQP